MARNHGPSKLTASVRASLARTKQAMADLAKQCSDHFVDGRYVHPQIDKVAKRERHENATAPTWAKPKRKQKVT